ncbi:MAG: TIGR03000 domain-containing protein [Planctomycetes bacterium]|nr:TIGR03000 domain-containing protein [Planctomycetota bacterium]
MRKLLLVAAVAGGLIGSAGAARAEGEHHWGPVRIPDIHQRLGPKSTSVTWPSVSPPGWYTDTYRHKWFYPWYAYYNYSQGPYANWMAGGGYAGYAYHGPAGYYYYPGLSGPAAAPAVPTPKKEVKPKEGETGGTLSVTLPADAKLLFNGVAADGSGVLRTFRTPPLEAGQSYRYELTAEVVRDGRTERAIGTVIVRAGETAAVALTPVPVVLAAK